MEIQLLMNSGILQGVVKTEEEAKEWLAKEIEKESHYKWTHGYPYTEELDTDRFKDTDFTIYQYFGIMEEAFRNAPDDSKYTLYSKRTGYAKVKKSDIEGLVWDAKEVFLKTFESLLRQKKVGETK